MTNELERGRLNSPFQHLKKNLRQVIYDRFDLEELDFDGFNLNLFFLKETGSKYDGDVYTDIMKRMGVIGKSDQRAYRPIFKQLVLTIFGVESREDAMGSFVKSLTEFGLWWDDREAYSDVMERWRAYLSDQGLDPDTRRPFLPVYDLIEAVEDVCSPIRNYLFRKLTDYAQNVESRVIVEIGKHMVADGLLPLLIHDALVVPQEFAKKYDVLKEEIHLREIGREKTQKSRDEEIERSQIA